MAKTPKERAKAIVKWYYPLKHHFGKPEPARLEARIAKEIQEAADEAINDGIALSRLCGND